MTGAALAGGNIATGGVEIVGKAQKTGTAFHQTASNIKAGQMAMQPGRYSKITFDRALKTAGLNGHRRPDVIGVARYGENLIVEVVSKSQTKGEMEAKCAKMLVKNLKTQSKVISWPRNIAVLRKYLLK